MEEHEDIFEKDVKDISSFFIVSSEEEEYGSQQKDPENSNTDLQPNDYSVENNGYSGDYDHEPDSEIHKRDGPITYDTSDATMCNPITLYAPQRATTLRRVYTTKAGRKGLDTTLSTPKRQCIDERVDREFRLSNSLKSEEKKPMHPIVEEVGRVMCLDPGPKSVLHLSDEQEREIMDRVVKNTSGSVKWHINEITNMTHSLFKDKNMRILSDYLKALKKDTKASLQPMVFLKRYFKENERHRQRGELHHTDDVTWNHVLESTMAILEDSCRHHIDVYDLKKMRITRGRKRKRLSSSSTTPLDETLGPPRTDKPKREKIRMASMHVHDDQNGHHSDHNDDHSDEGEDEEYLPSKPKRRGKGTTRKKTASALKRAKGHHGLSPDSNLSICDNVNRDAQSKANTRFPKRVQVMDDSAKGRMMVSMDHHGAQNDDHYAHSGQDADPSVTHTKDILSGGETPPAQEHTGRENVKETADSILCLKFVIVDQNGLIVKDDRLSKVYVRKTERLSNLVSKFGDLYKLERSQHKNVKIFIDGDLISHNKSIGKNDA